VVGERGNKKSCQGEDTYKFNFICRHFEQKNKIEIETMNKKHFLLPEFLTSIFNRHLITMNLKQLLITFRIVSKVDQKSENIQKHCHGLTGLNH
jgi:hypothetical protein